MAFSLVKQDNNRLPSFSLRNLKKLPSPEENIRVAALSWLRFSALRAEVADRIGKPFLRRGRVMADRNTSLLWLLPLAALVLSLGLLSGRQGTGIKKVALLVGVNTYKHRGFRELEFAERDMEKLAEELRNDKQFTVVVLKGSADGDLRATRENIDRQLQALLRDIGKEDLVLVAFSGHGQQLKVKRDGKEEDGPFFCPVDAVSCDPATQFSLSSLIDDVLATKGGKNLILVDACRNAFKDPGRGAKGVQGKRIATPPETAVFFSCQAGQESFEHKDADGGHGLFTYCVLEALRARAAKGGKVTWKDVVADVEERMASEELGRWRPEGAKQDPIEAGNIGRIVLVATAGDSRPPRDDHTVRREAPKRAVPPFDTDEAKALQQAWAKYLGCKVVEEVDLSGDVTLEMVLIPPGTFMMGAPEGEEEATSAEKPPGWEPGRSACSPGSSTRRAARSATSSALRLASTAPRILHGSFRLPPHCHRQGQRNNATASCSGA
jgi:hypothetical protein